MKLKKLLWLSTTVAGLAPLILAASCVAEDKIAEVSMSDKIYYITNGDKIQDKSVNESVWKGFNKIFKRNENTLSNIFELKNSNDFLKLYAKAEEKGGLLALVVGELHKTFIKIFQQTNHTLHFLLIDGILKNRNVASVDFDIQTPSFLMGLLAADKAVTKDGSNPRIAFYGDNNYSTSTINYIDGFKSGIEYYNKHNGQSAKDVVIQNEGFVQGSGLTSEEVAKKVVEGKGTDKPELVMGIGEELTNDLVKVMKKNNINESSITTQIIGVNTNLLNSIESKLKNWVFGSVTKNYEETIQNVGREATLDLVFSTSETFGKVYVGSLEKDEVGLIVGNTSGNKENDYHITEALANKLFVDPAETTPVNLTVKKILELAKTYDDPASKANDGSESNTGGGNP